MEVITLCLLCPCFQEALANRANSLCVAQAAVLEVITDGVRKGGVIEIGRVKREGDVIGALIATAGVPRRGAGSTRTRKTVAFSPKKGQLEVAAKPAGVSPFSHWEISLYIGSGYEETVLTCCRQSALAASAYEF